MLTNKQVEKACEGASKHVNKHANKENMCPQGTNVGLDVVFVDSLDCITNDPHANNHGSKKGTQDPVCKDRYEPARNMCSNA